MTEPTAAPQQGGNAPPDAELARSALALIQRAGLQGGEVDGFLVIRNWLAAIANGRHKVG